MTKTTDFLNHTTAGTSEVQDIRSYATQDALAKGLVKYGFDTHRYVVVKTLEGRYTAIFPSSNIKDGNMMRYAHRGFMTLG